MTQSNQPSVSDNQLPDKNWLYGRYQKHEDRKASLYRKAAHKALDIPETDEVIATDNSRQGMTWRELAVLGAAGLGGMYVYNQSNEPVPQQQPPAQVAPYQGPVDSEYEIRFYDKDGNPIDVPHISQRK